ncbi:hypothetical protein BIV57_08695 [Mangrovactinospora gilvigrisea]|uniref:Uncharacterized protein n=1 Tax=Mangrovactinospora gilvigrisea TaxID=1428644 RepID=A0A1J7BWS6_9ACTN|nr:hypothetical protein [Mangrovactinospora gilvigrisea]OIV37921.1 hypothetical protein BIV57_08695 [Mangrovactinospora gilvigrisea]
MTVVTAPPPRVDTGAEGETRAALRVLLSAAPADVPVVAERIGVAARALGPGPLTPTADPARRAAAREALRAGLAAGTAGPALAALARAARTAGVLDDLLALGVLDRVAPARTAAALLAGGPAVQPAPGLPELIGRHLGEEPARWHAVHAALPRWTGTLAALLTEAAPPAVEDVDAAPRTVHAAYRGLLDHAPSAAAAAAGLARLTEPRTAAAVLGRGAVPAVLAAAAAAAADPVGPVVRVALAANTAASPAQLRALLGEADEPAVAAAVYRNPSATFTLRHRIAKAASAPGRQPLDAGLRAELLALPFPSARHTTLLAPFLGSGDAELTAAALPVRSRAAVQTYALLAVWERHGTAAAQRIVARAEAAGHLRLRTLQDMTLYLGREPEQIAAALRRTRARFASSAEAARRLHSPRGVREPFELRPEALVKAHCEWSFDPRTAAVLARHEDATEEQRAVFLTTARRGRYASYMPGVESYLRQGLSSGTLTARHVLERTTPARSALRALDALPKGRELVADALGALVEAHLAGRPEAWAVAAQLLPEFTGSIAELAALAGQVAE